MDDRYIARLLADGKIVLEAKLIGSIPDDWQSTVYTLIAGEDPDNPGSPIAMWKPLAQVAQPINGYGLNYGGYYG